MIRIQDAVVSYGHRVILQGVTESFSPGAIVALMGPSGSGKSTLMAVLAGEKELSEGSLELLGASGSPSQAVEWVHQSSPMLLRRTALDNAVLSAVLQGRERCEAEDEGRELMSKLGIGHLLQEFCFRLSGGERQRVAVVRALLSKRPILLADEPTASLDAQARSAICDSLDLAAHLGRVVVVATHDPYVAQRCHRIVKL